MAVDVKIKLNTAAYKKYISDSARDLVHDKAKQLKKAAKMSVGRRTGALRRSIQIMNPKKGPKFYSIEVGSKLNYAYPHHEGTRSYIITPRPGHRVMKFKGGKNIATDANGYVYARRVKHPRVRANRYLTGPAAILFRK